MEWIAAEVVPLPDRGADEGPRGGLCAPAGLSRAQPGSAGLRGA